MEEVYNLDKREKKLKGGMRLSVRGERMKKRMREVKKNKKGEMKEGKERGWWRKILMGGFGKERERIGRVKGGM